MLAYKVLCKQHGGTCWYAWRLAVVRRDLEKLEEWTGIKLIIFNRVTHKLMHLERKISLYNCTCWRLTT